MVERIPSGYFLSPTKHYSLKSWYLLIELLILRLLAPTGCLRVKAGGSGTTVYDDGTGRKSVQ